jgi:hypothetical protein
MKKCILLVSFLMILLDSNAQIKGKAEDLSAELNKLKEKYGDNLPKIDQEDSEIIEKEKARYGDLLNELDERKKLDEELQSLSQKYNFSIDNLPNSQGNDSPEFIKAQDRFKELQLELQNRNHLQLKESPPLKTLPKEAFQRILWETHHELKGFFQAEKLINDGVKLLSVKIPRSNGTSTMSKIQRCHDKGCYVEWNENGIVRGKNVSYDHLRQFNKNSFTPEVELEIKKHFYYKYNFKWDLIEAIIKIRGLKNKLKDYRDIDLINSNIKRLEDNFTRIGMNVRGEKIDFDAEKCNMLAFNNNSKIAPDSNQYHSNLCYAHASAALLEEQLCKRSPQYCGKDKVSRAQVALINNKLIDNKSGLVKDVLKHFLSEKKFALKNMP